ncbi:hypothetical protein KLP28_14065 [Nocardioidaceae bacterium]|nr:hypothetical protein KLP28_14065 [Nocardioidaceae bacterium]
MVHVLRVLLPMLLVSGVLFALVWLAGDVSHAVRTRRRARRDEQLAQQTQARTESETTAIGRSRDSLRRAREARVYDQVADLLQQPDLDLLPERQVADVLTAVEDLQATGTTDGAASAELRDAALLHAETVVGTAARDLRAARLVGGDDD